MVLAPSRMCRYRRMSARVNLIDFGAGSSPSFPWFAGCPGAPREQPALSSGLTYCDAQCIPKGVQCCHPEFHPSMVHPPSWRSWRGAGHMTFVMERLARDG
jgi:hypothetical protein